MKIKLSLLFTLIAVGIHLYLTKHYYGLNFGFADGDSICNLNAMFDCDTVTASSFSSLFGIPMALWGAVTNGILAIMLLGSVIGWHDESDRHDSLTSTLAVFIAITSLVMGSISTFLIGTYCLFCIATYILSFITAYLVYSSQSAKRTPASTHLLSLFTSGKIYLLFVITIPVVAFSANYSMISKFGGQHLAAIISQSLRSWNANPTVNLSEAPSLSKGPQDAKMVISEFADFMCGHCKNAAPTLKAFAKANPDVRFNFYSFPLDGQCNDAITRTSETPCFLAKSVYCAEKLSQKGWEFHDAIYAHQEVYFEKPGVSYAKESVENFSSQLGVDKTELLQCIENEETTKAIRAQAKLGADAKISGTPSIFVNGRKLDKGQLIQVLDAAKKSL
jgi:protein-disulfide isomerase/uncharacterized membrane protein